jgi:sn-glycerol 3-phosphate transport system substrate-binding protein
MKRATALLLAVVGLYASACGNGESILNAGNERPDDTTPADTTPPDVTAPSGDTSPPGATSPPRDTAPPATTLPPPTTTTSTLSAFADCPVDALDDASDTVTLMFWHGLNAESEAGLITLTDAYNASQDRVRVQLENQGNYRQTIDKYVQSSQSSRPDLVMFPDYATQQTADSDSVIPIGACLEASGFDTSAFQPSTLTAYSSEGVQFGMPFNVSNPVLYYNKKVFEAAGLDPERPPRTLDEVRQFSQQIVDSGAASFGLAIDSGTDSGGGWFLEQWFANAGELYADNGNGRLAPATRVLYDGALGVELLTYVQQMINDGLIAYVGDNAGGSDTFLKLADRTSPAAMTIGTSAALGTVISALGGGLIPGLTVDDVGVGPMPGPGPVPTALVGGAALYIVQDKGDEKAAAAWDYITHLVSPESQSQYATDTGYVPVRSDALEVEPALTLYATDPRYRVAYDQLIGSPDDPALQGPILGPQREVRSVTASAVAEIFNGGDVQTALSAAAEQANLLIVDYAARN